MELDEAIKAVRSGDETAFAEIIEQTERRLRAYLALQAPDRELIDEVAHQAYITAYQKLDEYQTGTNFLAWLKRIAQFHLRNECRRRTHEGQTPIEKLSVLVAPGPSVSEMEDTHDRVAALMRCLEKLGPDARKMIDMRYTDCLEPTIIARQTGRNASSIRTTLTRLRQSLLQCMEGQHAG
jgi:RNA polymerase sigma-70 factor, ECF subfamily